LAAHAVLTRLARASNVKVWPTSSDIVKGFSDDASWDLTILSYAHAVQLDTRRSLNEPVFLGFLCDDSFKLLARGSDPTLLTTLYQFGGLHSTYVTRLALADFPLLREEQLNATTLAYLLYSWSPEVGLLLKEPLATIYSWIAKRENDLKEIKRYTLPLCLFGSAEYLSKHTDDLPRVYSFLRYLLSSAKVNAEDFVATLYSFRIEDDLLRFILPRKAQHAG
jgi:hypothetical protein